MSTAPWAARDSYPFLDLLEAHVDTFRRELATLPDAAFVPMPSTEMYHGVWRGCVLRLDIYGAEFPGLDLAANRARCPETTALLDAIPGVLVGGFLTLAPGAYLDWHEDIRDDDVVRAHLALDLPTAEQAHWPLGRARLMDIRMRHRAVNDGDRPRVTLMVDVRMPFQIPTGALPRWNP